MSTSRPSSFAIVITLSLVIFLLGLLGILLINAAKLNTHIKENIELTVFFNTDLQNEVAKKISDSLLQQRFVKNGTYISGEDAVFNFKNEIGDDFVEILGNNPLPASLEVSVAKEFTDNLSMQRLERELANIPGVLEVSYPKNVFHQIDKNRRVISYWLLALSLVMIVVAVVLMSNTIRILIYADRFLIKNQQLIGAKEGFILAPYKKRAFRWTIISFLIGSGFLIAVIWILLSWLNVSMDLNMRAILHHFTENWYQYILMLFLLLIGSVVIIYIATLLSAKKYLNIHTDNIYT
jgi:cell division transport system permease protein